MRSQLAPARRALPLATALAAACGGGDGAPKPIVPTRITFAAQPDSALVGDTVALGASAVDGSGRVATTYSLSYASSDSTVARVSAAGTVRVVGPGTATFTARVAGLSGTAAVSQTTSALVALTPAARIRAVPTRVDAAPGVVVPITTLVYDSAGNVISFPVHYAVDNGTVATVSGNALTAKAAGSATLTATAQLRNRALASSSIPVGVVALTPGPFTITLVPVGTPNPAYAALFQRAAAFWETVITAALPSATFSVPAEACDTGTPALTTTTTGLTIFFAVDSIDGTGKILGEAGPCVLRSDASGNENGLTVLGSMRFDSADISGLVQRGQAFDVIRHEMGHVLGIGTLWNVDGVRTDLVGENTYDPRYVGPQGQAASAVLGYTTGSVGAPVENVGGDGTANAHWRTSVFSPELMVGYLASGTVHPASRLTIQSLADLGYSVSVAASEPLTPPSNAVASARAPSASVSGSVGASAGAFDLGFRDVALPPLYRVSRAGVLHTLRGLPVTAAVRRPRPGPR